MTVTSPPVYNGRYELSHQIARGGTAQVYLARDLLLDRPVALKVLFPELSTDHTFVERFRREAQAAANLSHPNIVPVFDWGESDRTYYIVMEYVDGEPLSAVLKAQGPIDPSQAAAVAADIAKALSYAHRHGVVHRDIKPGNVLITVDGEVKVTDFGIARAIGTEENITQTGLVMGTATYFSPEQAQGLGVDGRSDIYSLGVVLFECVTGRPPFTGETPVSIAYQHVREPAPTPRSINPSVPPSLEAVIMKAMAKQPSDRYETAQDFQEDLKLFVQGLMPTAANPGAAAAAAAAEAAERTSASPRSTPTSVLAAAGPEDALVVAAPVDRRDHVAAGNGLGAGALAATPETSKDVAGVPPLPKTRTPHWLIAGALLCLLILLIIFIGGRQLGYFGAKPWFGMPPLTGDQLTAARAVLTKDGLNSTTNYQFSDTIQPQTVMSQSIATGQLVQQGNSVVLTVSKGHFSTPVPNVVGMSQESAVKLLKSKGFDNIKIAEAPVPQGSKVTTVGDVWKQSPVATTVMSHGDQVVITVVILPTTITVPANIVGLSQTEAENVLLQLGFTLATPPVSLTEVASQTVPINDVEATAPGVGTSHPRGTPVQLILSSGPPPVSVVVPPVAGQTLAAATSTLSSAGFTVLQPAATKTTCTASQNNLVDFTDPAAGSPEPKGAQITIYVWNYQPNSPLCGTTSTTGNTGPTGNSGNPHH